MPTPIFLSYPNPYTAAQENFIDSVKKHLTDNSFSPLTLGVTDYAMEAPLVKIRDMMSQCYGLLSIAFRRGYIEKGKTKPDSSHEYDISDNWLTSPYCYIEPAMAFQLNMPVLIFRENQVIEDGILEKGVLGSYMPEFCLDSPHNNYFESKAWNQLFDQWKKKVLEYYKFKDF